MKSKDRDLKGQRIFEVLRTPVVTEKSTQSMAENRYVFKVASDATKPEIKAAVETVFKVKVEAVNTWNQDGKQKRFRGRLGTRPSYKKASVRLAQGQTIDTGARI